MTIRYHLISRHYTLVIRMKNNKSYENFMTENIPFICL